MKDAVATMGTILTDDVGGRDAVHVAVIAVKAGRVLHPGDHVGLSGDTASREAEHIGIVDPFITSQIHEGQRFWLYLYPRTITSLRHNWTHPAFADGSADSAYGTPAAKMASEQWLRAFIDRSDCPGYETLIAAAVGDHSKNYGDEAGYPGYLNSSNDGEYLHFGGRDAHGDIPPEFWDHVQIVTGKKIESGQRAKYFSCSC